MKYTKDELVSSKDTFQRLKVGNIGRFGIKKEKSLAIEIQFGFNLKSDNQSKTKQLKLF